MPLDTDLINWNKENSWPQSLSVTFGSTKLEQFQLNSSDQNKKCRNSPEKPEERSNLREGLLDLCSWWRGQNYCKSELPTLNTGSSPSQSFFPNLETNVRKKNVRIVLGELNNLSFGSSNKKLKMSEGEAKRIETHADGTFSDAEEFRQNSDAIST